MQTFNWRERVIENYSTLVNLHELCMLTKQQWMIVQPWCDSDDWSDVKGDGCLCHGIQPLLMISHLLCGSVLFQLNSIPEDGQ